MRNGLDTGPPRPPPPGPPPTFAVYLLGWKPLVVPWPSRWLRWPDSQDECLG